MISFDKFNAEKEKYAVRIGELREELAAAETTLETLEQARAAALADFMVNVDISQQDTAIEEARKRVDSLQARVTAAETSAKATLSDLIPGVTLYEDKAAEKAVRAYEEAIEELNVLKAQYLQHAVKIGQLAKQVNEIHSTANSIRSLVGVEPIKHWPFEDRLHFRANPAINGFEQAARETYCIDSWLVKAAMNGQLPAFA